MPTNGSLKTYGESLLDLAWSLWSELGVSSLARRHPHWVVDPEELLLFTAWLADRDARLREECIDWCIRFGDVLSVDRLKNLLDENDDASRVPFSQLSYLVRKHKGPKLPFPATTTRSFKPSGKSRRPDVTRASNLGLRMRKLFGVSAKAEIITRLLVEPARVYTVTELADVGLGFARITVSKALDDLVDARAVHVDRSRRGHQFRLETPPGLVESLDLSVAWRPSWDLLFRLLRVGDDILSRPDRRDARVAMMDQAEDESILAPLVGGLLLETMELDYFDLPNQGATVGAGGGVAVGLRNPVGAGSERGRLFVGSRREATAHWLSTVASALAAGIYPGRLPESALSSDEFALYRVLRSLRSRASSATGHRPEYGSDQTLRLIVKRSPKSLSEIRLLADQRVRIDPALGKAYLKAVKNSAK